MGCNRTSQLPFAVPYRLLFGINIAVDSVELANVKYAINGIVLPPIPLGSQNPGQTDLPFCLHARYETQRLGWISQFINSNSRLTKVI